jgi:hypothetical protein
MLSAADSELVRLDPGLPGLGTLLDPEAFVARLRQSLPSLDLESAKLTYLKYRPTSRCLVGYRLQGVQGWELDVSATTYPSSQRGRLARARKLAMEVGSGTGLIVLDDCASIVQVFPRDRRLPALARLADCGKRRRLLDELLPGRPEFRHAGIYSLAYKPECRHVALVQARDGTRAIIKAYRQDAYEAARLVANAFEARGGLRIPRLLGHSDRHRLLAFEWLPGRTLEGALTSVPTNASTAAVAGAGLAVLHDQNPYRLGLRERRREEAALFATAKVLRYLCPDRGQFAEGLARHLAERLGGTTPAPRALHGNFHARHILLADNGVAFLDLDRATRGNPAADLGSFLADLELLVVNGEMSEATAASFRLALLDGYQTAVRRVAPAWLEIYTAIGLFQQVLQPFRLRATDWPLRVATILQRCASIVHWPAHSVVTRVQREDDTAELDAKAARRVR